jgi:LysR family transcriptional regulator, hypochlorite-specific transcription factor HypT
MEDMEPKWLEDFLSVARTGNFSQSASEMNITQSAFSRRIKALEQWVGVALIDRSTYPTRLTPAGERFREAAREATAALLKTRQDLRQALDADRKLLRIAIQHSLAASFLAPWLARLPLARDDLLVRATADNLHDCVRELEEGSVDLLVCYTHADLPLRLEATRYPSMPLAADALVPVSQPGRAGRPRHALQTGAPAVPWLAYSEGTFLSRAASLALRRSGAPPVLHPVVESALAEALRGAAIAGLGVAWLPLSLVADDLARGLLVRAGGAEFDVDLQICLCGEK